MDICARFLNRNSPSPSVSTWALGVSQLMLRSGVREMNKKEHGLHFMTGHPCSLPNGDVVSPGLSFGTAQSEYADGRR